MKDGFKKGGSACLLLMVLLVPCVLITVYEKIYLQLVDHSGRATELEALLPHLRSTFQETTQTIQTKLSHLISSSLQNYPAEEFLQLHQKLSSNLWLSPFSLNRKVNILNVLISETEYSQNIQSIELSISRGLEWFNAMYEMNLTLVRWNEDIVFEELPVNSLVLITQKLSYDIVDENIARRLRKGEWRDQYYVQDIVKELRSTALFSHCKYINILCNMKTLIFTTPTTQKDTYANIENQIYFLEKRDLKAYYNVLADCLSLFEFEKMRKIVGDSKQLIEVYHLLLREIFLKECVRVLEYIDFTFKPISSIASQIQKRWRESPQRLYDFLLKGKHVSPYLHSPTEDKLIDQIIVQIKAFLSSESAERLEVDPMTDVRIGRIDFFPNNFKVGVFLPLLIIFIYPLLIIGKDFLMFICKSVGSKCKSKGKSSIEVDSHND